MRWPKSSSWMMERLGGESDSEHYCLAYTLDEYRIINTYVRRFSGKLEDDGIICYLRDFDMYYWKVEEITKEEYFIEII